MSGRGCGGAPVSTKTVVEVGIDQLDGRAGTNNGPGETDAIVGFIKLGSQGIFEDEIFAVVAEAAGPGAQCCDAEGGLNDGGAGSDDDECAGRQGGAGGEGVGNAVGEGSAAEIDGGIAWVGEL